MFRRWFEHQAKQMPPEELQQMERDFSQIEYIDISNCAQYFYENEDEYWDITTDFPTLTSPWLACWMEFKVPKRSMDGGKKLMALYPDDLYCGAVITCFEFKEDAWEKVIKEDFGMQLFMRGCQAYNRAYEVDFTKSQERIEKAIANDRRARWFLNFDCFISIGRQVAWTGRHQFYLDPQGKAVPEFLLSILSEQVKEYAEANPLSQQSETLPYCYAISLLHCKNVETTDATFPRTIRRRFQKSIVPDVRFKQLVVHPMRKQKRYEKQEDDQESHASRRLHICRGHFKDYREGKGLFGKYKDVYWWDQQLRGDLDQGIIVKDYVVEEPALDIPDGS
jgi:hypothetical protein